MKTKQLTEAEEWKGKFKLLSKISFKVIKELGEFIDEIADTYPNTDKFITERMEEYGQVLHDSVGFMNEMMNPGKKIEDLRKRIKK